MDRESAGKIAQRLFQVTVKPFDKRSGKLSVEADASDIIVYLMQVFLCRIGEVYLVFF